MAYDKEYYQKKVKNLSGFAKKQVEKKIDELTKKDNKSSSSKSSSTKSSSTSSSNKSSSNKSSSKPYDIDYYQKKSENLTGFAKEQVQKKINELKGQKKQTQIRNVSKAEGYKKLAQNLYESGQQNTDRFKTVVKSYKKETGQNIELNPTKKNIDQVNKNLQKNTQYLTNRVNARKNERDLSDGVYGVQDNKNQVSRMATTSEMIRVDRNRKSVMPTSNNQKSQIKPDREFISTRSGNVLYSEKNPTKPKNTLLNNTQRGTLRAATSEEIKAIKRSKNPINQFTSGVKSGLMLNTESIRRAKDDPTMSSAEGTGVVIGSVGNFFALQRVGKAAGATSTYLKSLSRTAATVTTGVETTLGVNYAYQSGRSLIQSDSPEDFAKKGFGIAITAGAIGSGASKGAKTTLKAGFKPKSTFFPKPKITKNQKYKDVLSEINKIDSGKVRATGTYKPTTKTTTTSSYNTNQKTRVKVKSEVIDKLIGRVDSKKVSTFEVIGDKKASRLITYKKDPRIEVRQIIDTQKGTLTQQRLYKGKVKKTEVGNIFSQSKPSEVRVTDPVRTSEQITSNNKGYLQRTSQSQFNMKTSAGEYSGQFTTQTSQFAKVRKPYREIKSEIVIDTKTKSNPINRKRVKQNVEFIDGKSAPKKDVVEGVLIKDKKGIKLLPTKEVRQARAKSSTTQKIDLSIEYSSKRDGLQVTKKVKPQKDSDILSFIQKTYKNQAKTNTEAPQITQQVTEAVKVAKTKPVSDKKIASDISKRLNIKNKFTSSGSKSQTSSNIIVGNIPNSQEQYTESTPPQQDQRPSQPMIQSQYQGSNLGIKGNMKIGIKPSSNTKPNTQIKSKQNIFQRDSPSIKTSSSSRYDTRIKPISKTQLNPKQDISVKQEQNQQPITRTTPIQTQAPKKIIDTNYKQTTTPIGIFKQQKIFPPVRRMGNQKQISQGTGYDVFVRKKGVFKKVNVNPFSKDQARNYGEFVVGNTAAASFKLEKSRNKIGGKFTGRGISEDFKKKDGVFIEKKERRIKSKGELKEITYKGIFARKTKKRLF